MRNYNNKLVQLRQKAGLSQKQVASVLNIARSSYNNYEQGVCEPSIERLIKLADYYNVTLDYLVGRPFSNDFGFMTDIEKDLVNMFRQMSKDNQKIYYSEAKGILLTQS